MDPVPRFELGSARWRRAVLPLNDTGKHSDEESNPTHRFWKPGPGHWTIAVNKASERSALTVRRAGPPVTLIARSEKAAEARAARVDDRLAIIQKMTGSSALLSPCQ